MQAYGGRLRRFACGLYDPVRSSRFDSRCAAQTQVGSFQSGHALIHPCNCHSFRRATRRITQLYDRLLAPSELRATQFVLMVEIEKLGPIALSSLASVMVMDRATLGHNIRPLQADGYVTLSVGKDRRSRDVAVTASGQRILAEARPLWKRAQSMFEGKIGTETAEGLRSELNHIAETDFLSG